MLSPILITTFLAFSLAEKCEYPSASDTTRAYERLAQDQETTLIPKVCFNENQCGDDVCARDPDVLSFDTGCIWCENTNPSSCEDDPSDETDSDDFYDCYELTSESCGCIDNREADIAVLIDVTGQTVETFNYYLLYFTYWFNEEILDRTDNTNIRYILYTDEVVYSGTKPYDEYGFEMKDNEDVPEAMSDLPDDIDGADDPDFCVALDEMLDFFDKYGKYDTQMMYWIPTKDHDNDALKDCLDDDDALDDIRTFALRFWSDTDLERFEDVFGDLNWCQYFQKPSYVPSEGNSPDSRYFVLTMSDFVCLDAAQLTDAPTDDPTSNPSPMPTDNPTVNPTLDPTENPVEETDEPTVDPTADPTEDPLSRSESSESSESNDPTEDPTEVPSVLPSMYPSEYPTEQPTYNPSETPTEDPTEEPSTAPTDKSRTWWGNEYKSNERKRRRRPDYKYNMNGWNEHAVRRYNDDTQHKEQMSRMYEDEEEEDDEWVNEANQHWKTHWKSFYEDRCRSRDVESDGWWRPRTQDKWWKYEKNEKWRK